MRRKALTGHAPTRMQGFNRAAERLGLLNGAGAPGKRARGVAYEARVDRTAAAAADFVSADLKVCRSHPLACS